jgi:transcriptional regulator with XRE-family HTH domain
MSGSLDDPPGVTRIGAVQDPGPVAADPRRARRALWWQYVQTVTGKAAQKDIAAATSIDQSSISRWQRGTSNPRAEAVIALARAYGRSPVEALVAAGYLDSDELGVVELTTLTGDLTGAAVDALLIELRQRVLGRQLSESAVVIPDIEIS